MRNNKMDKYYIREKIYSDKNLEKKIKEEVENYLDNSVLKLYPPFCVSEYSYNNNFEVVTAEIFEDSYILSDIHIEVDMVIYDYISHDDYKKERKVLINNKYFIGFNIRFSLNSNNTIENLILRYFNIYAISKNE
ncbi:hypothetical protein R4I97_00885 [Brachyspira pilosicoli]|uniref:hypothetical protein n=1 Tax=Brachyspira pilosicoli TaxID=52584 RepID=UPI0030078396